MEFGPKEEGPPCPGIGVTVDSCATFNTMHFDFAKYTAKTWPHCISVVYTGSQYNSIFLYGIVQVNDEVVSTFLPVAFKFITHYMTRDGRNITVIFACGPNVAVNAIIGLPFLKSTGSIMDMHDNILGMTKVKEHPFPIDFRVPCTTTPISCTHTATVNKLYYGNFLEDLDKVTAHVNMVFMASIVMGVAKKIRFDL